VKVISGVLIDVVAAPTSNITLFVSMRLYQKREKTTHPLSPGLLLLDLLGPGVYGSSTTMLFEVGGLTASTGIPTAELGAES